jgi:hypothetical protein
VAERHLTGQAQQHVKADADHGGERHKRKHEVRVAFRHENERRCRGRQCDDR